MFFAPMIKSLKYSFVALPAPGSFASPSRVSLSVTRRFEPRRPKIFTTVRPLSRFQEAAAMSSKLPEGVTRSGLPPFVKEFVTVQNPDVLRKLASSPDILRPAEVELPWILRYYFKATKFFYPPTNRWVIAHEGDDKNNRPERRKAVEDLLAKGFTDAHIAKFTELVKGDGDLVQVGAEVAKVFAEIHVPLPEGEAMPQDVAEAAASTAIEFKSVVFNPLKYWAARAARYKVEEWLRTVLPEDAEVGDYSHNLGASAQGFGTALISMRDMQTSDIRTHFVNNPIIKGTMRMPARTTTVDGLFPDDAPLLPGSIIVMDTATAARKTLDDMFLFSSGVDVRQCPFKGLFFETTTEIQKRMTS